MKPDLPQVTLIRLGTEHPNALYHRYSGQDKPQPCYIWLDLEAKTMGAAYNPEVGNGIPMDVWHGLVRRYTIPCLTNEAADKLLESLWFHAREVLAATKIEWEGSNRVARLGAVAAMAEEKIEGLCMEEHAFTNDHVSVWEAADWYSGLGDYTRQADHLGITADTSDSLLKTIEENERRASIKGGEVDVLEGHMAHLEALRDELRRLAAAAKEAAEEAPAGWSVLEGGTDAE